MIPLEYTELIYKHGWWQAPVDKSHNTYVQHRKGRYFCDKECIQYECKKACSHIVAVALKNGRLDEYLALHLRNNPMPNMTTLAESGLPKASTGKKPAKREGVSRKVSK